MIKVIASDMDGTLLGDDHRIAPETLKAVKEAVNAGIRFMICTGRNFAGAMQELEGTDLVCDYIVGSGAEVRDPEQNVVLTYPMSMELCRRVYRVIREYPVSMVICTNGYDYRIGTTDEVEESILLEAMLFHMNLSREEVKKTPVYLRMIERTKIIADLAELEEKGVPVYKLFLFSEDRAMLEESSAILSDYLGTPKGRLGALAEKASVDTYLTSAAPPFYIQHGTRDTIIPPIQAIDFAGRLRGLIGGEKVVLDLIEGAKHVGTSPEFIEEEHVLPILRFFRTLL